MPSFIEYIPTELIYLGGFFDLVSMSPTDVVYDLGCGDGRLLFAAIEKGAGRAVGVEIDHQVILLARDKAKEKRLEDKVTFLEGDILQTNLADATVVFCYLIGEASQALKPKFEAELNPGTRVVMELFPVPGWKPERMIELDGGIDYGVGYRTFYLYVMPPKYES
jgi:SAM-dependent methyltransferase